MPDKITFNDPFGVLACDPDQAQVPVVQVAHRRHERDVVTCVTPVT